MQLFVGKTLSSKHLANVDKRNTLVLCLKEGVSPKSAHVLCCLDITISVLVTGLGHLGLVIV